MSNDIQTLEAQWDEALANEDVATVEKLVQVILREHPNTPLACELRYKRGLLTLTEGEGIGSERLAKALNEFRVGLEGAQAVGPDSEPWRSLNHTQIGICLARRNNIDGAVKELQQVVNYRPRSSMGLGALALITEILEKDGREREAKRFKTQRLSFARALVRENPESPELNSYKFILAQELLDSTYNKEGQQLLEELSGMDEETLGTELFHEIQAFKTSLD